MPATVHTNLKEARAKLKAVDRRLVPQFNAEIRKVAEPVRAEASRLAPRSGRSRSGSVSVNVRVKRTNVTTRKSVSNQHLADTLKIRASGSTAVIYSKKSGASVVNYGGRHPLFGDKDHWYRQKPTLFMQRAGEKYAARIEREIDLMVRHLLDRL
jgi:hypothetical protein